MAWPVISGTGFGSRPRSGSGTRSDLGTGTGSDLGSGTETGYSFAVGCLHF